MLTIIVNFRRQLLRFLAFFSQQLQDTHTLLFLQFILPLIVHLIPNSCCFRRGIQQLPLLWCFQMYGEVAVLCPRLYLITYVFGEVSQVPLRNRIYLAKVKHVQGLQTVCFGKYLLVFGRPETPEIFRFNWSEN